MPPNLDPGRALSPRELEEQAKSQEEIRRLIRELRGLDKQAVGMEDLKRLVGLLIGFYAYCPPVIDQNQYVYRAVMVDGPKPNRVERLSYPPYPPRCKLTSDGRANRADTRLFYCCPSEACTLREIGAEMGSSVVVGKWQFRGAPQLHVLGFTEKALIELGSRRDCPDFNKVIEADRFSRSYLDRRDEIHEFLAEAFTVRIKKGVNDYDYKLTIALAEIYLGSPAFDGIWYPSVATNGGGDSLALKTEYVDANLDFVSGEYGLVTAGDGITVLDTCLPDAIGGLVWGFHGAIY